MFLFFVCLLNVFTLFAKVTIFWYFWLCKDKSVKTMSKTKSTSIETHFDTFSQNLPEQQEAKLKSLKQSLINGEQSGFVKDFNPLVFLQKLRQKTEAKTV